MKDQKSPPRLTDESMPNVMAHSFLTDEGTKITLFKSHPGDTSPRMQMHGQAMTVVNPERFGPYGTAKEFRAWCQAYVAEGAS